MIQQTITSFGPLKDNRIKSGEITARAEESLGGIRLVKAFAQEEYELARFMEKSLDF